MIPRRFSGSSLVELLLALAVVAVLVAIALPRYERAQVRSKVSQARADLRTFAQALEAYAVDYKKYPGDGAMYSWTYPRPPYDYFWYLPSTLTTPVAYANSVSLEDPFRAAAQMPLNYRRYRYTYVDMTWGTAGTRYSPSQYYEFLKGFYGSWKLNSAGPDGTFGPYYPTDTYPGNRYPELQLPYDPSNGTISPGDILRSQRSPLSE